MTHKGNKKVAKTTQLAKWRRISSRIILEHPRLTLVEDTLQLPTGKNIRYLRHENKGNGGVIIVCIRDDKILVQQQYSYPVDEVLYQFPGGRIEEGESYTAAADRELAEEARLAMVDAKYLGWFYPDNRRTSAKLHVVFSDTTEDTPGTPDDDEIIENIWLPLAEFRYKLANNDLPNYALLAAWSLLITKKPEILEHSKTLE